MSSIQAVCPMLEFLGGIAEICLNTKEMGAYSDELVERIDDTVRVSKSEEYKDWKMAVAPWSSSRGWKWVDEEDVNIPVYMQECSGDLCKKLKAFLPNSSLGEVTAIYAFVKMFMGYDGDPVLLAPHLGPGLNVHCNNIAIDLYKFPRSNWFCLGEAHAEAMRKYDILARDLSVTPGSFLRTP